MRILYALIALVLFSSSALAQNNPGYARVVAACGTPPYPYTVGSTVPILVDTNGNPCGGSATASSPSYPAGTYTTLDIKTVTTGGTAVNALSAGHCKYGCTILNPDNATQNLCGNENGTASGTHTNGDTWCALPGSSLTFFPTASAVSVISSDSSHPFGGAGTQ